MSDDKCNGCKIWRERYAGLDCVRFNNLVKFGEYL